METLTNEATRTQLREIRQHLERFGWIDKPTAMEICDCDRLGARIWDLRNAPWRMDIVTETVTKKNRFGHAVRFARYRLRDYKEARDGTV